MNRSFSRSAVSELTSTQSEPEVYVMCPECLLKHLTPQELQRMAELYQVAYERALHQKESLQQPDPLDDLGLGI